ncbi:MAG TPA: ribokinase [Pseudogracilibacillus sp.]|nr:ribokinase [Pseudogracilibacillus sp.]
MTDNDNQPTVCVVGSINMDVTISTDRIPAQGETVIGGNFATYFGGKGANQAVAAARAGANVKMIGAVGADDFGHTSLTHLQSENIDTTAVDMMPDVSTGVANIILTEQDNRIIVASGANFEVTPEIIASNEQQIKDSDVVLLQLELPIKTVQRAIQIANRHGVPVILNPAPYAALSKETLEMCTYMTPNEIELADMLQLVPFEVMKEKLIVTLGSYGVSYYDQGDERQVEGYDVAVKDTTGAGDTFNGVLAAMIAKKWSTVEAIRFANAAAGLSITKEGAQRGVPTLNEIYSFIETKKQ